MWECENNLIKMADTLRVGEREREREREGERQRQR